MARNTTQVSTRGLAMAGAILTWLTVILQFYLILVNSATPAAETVIRFFSYFTILTNILVACSFTKRVTHSITRTGSFFSRPATLTAILVYISFVATVYNLILRFLWNPQGVQWLVDESLHTIIPFFYILFWLFFIPKSTLQWKNIPWWFIFPLLYLLIVLWRGSLSGFYPYPFIDVTRLGYQKVFQNSALLVLAFTLFSIAYMALAKFMSKKPYFEDRMI